MAEREIERWVTISGQKVPIFKDGSMGVLSHDHPRTVADHNEDVKQKQMAKAQAERDKLNGKSGFDPIKASDGDYTDKFIHDKFHTFCEECISEEGKDPNFTGAKAYINNLLKNSQFDYGDIKSLITTGRIGNRPLRFSKNGKQIEVNPYIFRLVNGGVQFNTNDTSSGWIDEEYLD